MMDIASYYGSSFILGEDATMNQVQSNVQDSPKYIRAHQNKAKKRLIWHRLKLQTQMSGSGRKERYDRVLQRVFFSMVKKNEIFFYYCEGAVVLAHDRVDRLRPCSVIPILYSLNGKKVRRILAC